MSYVVHYLIARELWQLLRYNGGLPAVLVFVVLAGVFMVTRRGRRRRRGRW